MDIIFILKTPKEALLKSIHCLLLLCCFFMGSVSIQASQYSGVYRIEMPVSDDSSMTRSVVLKEALSKVFFRASGQLDALSYINKQENKINFESYVRSYNYKKKQINGQSQLVVNFTFDKKEIMDLLRSEGIEVWGGRRPPTLAWLTLSDNHDREIVSDNSHVALKQNLYQAFEDVGLRLILPTMDYTDNEALPVDKAWGLFSDSILSASRRYDVQSILAARLMVTYKNNRPYYSGLAQLIFNKKINGLKLNNVNDKTLSINLSYFVSSVLSKYYAINASNNATVSIIVDRIKSADDYSNMLKYLQKLTAVQSLTITKVQADSVSLLLDIDGNKQQFIDTIALDDKLKKSVLKKDVSIDVGNTSNELNESSFLRYTWNSSL